MKHTLSKADRLKSYSRIRQLFEKGNKVKVQPLLFQYQISRLSDLHGGTLLQMGVSVGARHFRRAVDRNLLKRRIREAYRVQKHLLLEKLMETDLHLDLFVIYLGNEMSDYKLLYGAMEQGLINLEQRIGSFSAK